MTTPKRCEAVAYGMRRKGEKGLIGLIPPKVHAIPPKVAEYLRDYEEIPLYDAFTVAALQGEVSRLRAERDNLKVLADEAVYVGCMIGLDCASALADLQERGTYTPQCNDGKPSRANARRDADKIADIYRRGLTLMRAADNLEPPTDGR
jgi:hypothetical protein